MTPLFATPPTWFDESKAEINRFFVRWGIEDMYNYMAMLGFRPNQRRMDAEHRTSHNTEKTCDVCKKKDVISECGLCGEIYCSRACMKVAWSDPAYPHRNLCELVVENGRCNLLCNMLHAKEKFTQEELNIAYGYPASTKPTAFVRTSTKRSPPPPSVKVSKEIKLQQLAGTRCCNPSCLKKSTVSVPHKACQGCRLVVYCSRECQKESWSLHKKGCKKNQETTNIVKKDGIDLTKHYRAWSRTRNNLLHIFVLTMLPGPKIFTHMLFIFLQHIGNGHMRLSSDGLCLLPIEKPVGEVDHESGALIVFGKCSSSSFIIIVFGFFILSLLCLVQFRQYRGDHCTCRQGKLPSVVYSFPTFLIFPHAPQTK
jgi:hypothetical protein